MATMRPTAMMAIDAILSIAQGDGRRTCGRFWAMSDLARSRASMERVMTIFLLK
jgi:hypothetical protein